MARKRKAEPDRLLVRATVNMDGLRAGTLAYVNPADPWMKDALDHGWLVEEPDTSTGRRDSRQTSRS